MFRIGEMAQMTGVSVDTLRYYEKSGLLTASRRSTGGYRYYSEQDLRALRFILRSKQLGFSLEEITELLALRVEPSRYSCQEVKQVAERKLADIDQRLHDLKQLRDSLARISDACCGGPHSAEHCSILEALEDSLQENEL